MAGGDELNLIERGSNYGWPVVSNGNHYDGTNIPDHPTRPDFNAPEAWWTPVIAPAGFVIYSGNLFPWYRGKGFIGGLASQALVEIEFTGTQAREARRYPMGRRIREVEQGPDGAIYLADSFQHRIVRLDPKTHVATLFAGTGKAGFAGDGGPAVKAAMNEPHSIQFDREGRGLFICDIRNHRIRRVDLTDGSIDTWCGTGEAKDTPDGARVGKRTPLKGPRALDRGSDGDLWLALREGNAVYRIDMKAGFSQRYTVVVLDTEGEALWIGAADLAARGVIDPIAIQAPHQRARSAVQPLAIDATDGTARGAVHPMAIDPPQLPP